MGGMHNLAKTVLAIINPVSGRWNVRPVVRQVERELARHGGRLDILVTRGPGQATAFAARRSADADAVLVVGGDGTICEVLNGLTERPLPMVVLRTGTENLLARELGMPTTPEDVVQTLLRGKELACDVGVINGRRFVSVSGAGFDAECVRRLTTTRRGHITYADYFWPIWRTFWSHRFPSLRVEADGEEVFAGRGLALIGVIGRYAVGLHISNHARLDDGLLDLCVVPCASRTALAAQTSRALLRRRIGVGRAVCRQCETIRITSPDQVPIQVDGDVGGSLPAVCSILPRAAKFLRLP